MKDILKRILKVLAIIVGLLLLVFCGLYYYLSFMAYHGDELP